MILRKLYNPFCIVDVLMIFSIGLGLILGYLVLDRFFLLEKVAILGSFETPLGVDDIRGKNILFTQENDVAELILQKNIDIVSVRIEKIFPATLRVYIKRRQPVAQVEFGSYFYIVDHEGIIFDIRNKRANLPRIDALIDNIKVGYQFENKYINSVFDFLLKLRDLKIIVVRVKIKSPDEIIFITDSINIITNTERDGQISSSSLQTLLRGFRIEGKIPKVVDLRFDKPIVRFY